jgi:hypothetical protein
VDDAAVVAGRALGLDRARVAGRRVGPIDDLFLRVLGLAAWQGLLLWTAVPVRRGVVAELTLAVEGCPLVEIGQGEERPDGRILEGDDVLGRAVGRVPGHLVRPQLAPKADAPEQIAQQHVLHDVGRVTSAATMMRCFPPSTT